MPRGLQYAAKTPQVRLVGIRLRLEQLGAHVEPRAPAAYCRRNFGKRFGFARITSSSAENGQVLQRKMTMTLIN